VGDKIRVTDIFEGTVTEVHDRTIRVDGSSVALPAPDKDHPWTRTIEVIERAPVPWQAGDIARAPGGVQVRQESGRWLNAEGKITSTDDAHADVYWTPVVRGGKRVAS
jgi:hypothetical protein